MSSKESQVEEQPVQDTPTPGTMLRQARERLGLTQLQMAEKLFLKKQNIEDIESDRLDENMSVTFAKGYVRMYAKQVGIDDNLVILEFEKIHTTTKPPAKLQSFSRRVAKQAHDDRWMMVTWIIILLLLAAFVVWWYQQPDDKTALVENETTTTTSAAVKALTSDTENVDTGDADTKVNEAALSAADKDDAIENEAPASEGEDLSVQAETVQSDASIPTDSDNLPTQSDITSQASDSDVGQANPVQSEENNLQAEVVDVVFTFAEDCWVNIEDATSEAIAYGVKTAGRVMPISGVPPFKVTLGAPDGVSITYDGEAVDISQFQDGRIARFSLPMQD
ncbi:RodZ domain-containing protein [Alteromonas sp. 14N.309.X.WAT.G.H12]|uniref:RodZ domain-containing protein n=1 Tax=Alteromonas sp. 14N.309.X.WAT.G.H12 TaxID=3120824 RepID=UPI002FD5E86D